LALRETYGSLGRSRAGRANVAVAVVVVGPQTSFRKFVVVT